jgi:hypothetical protein
MLEHAVLERDVIILAPATKRVKQEDGVLVTLLDKLFTGILEQEAVTIMEGVADLEGVDGIGTLSLDLLGNLRGSVAVLVHAVIKLNTLEEAHGRARYEPWALGHNRSGTGVLVREAAENARADFFLAVGVEDGLSNSGVNLVLVPDGEFSLAFKSNLLFFSHVHGDGDREQVSLTLIVSHGLHLDGLEEFHFVHEALEGESPSVTNSLQVLGLHLIDVNTGQSLSGSHFGLILLDEAFNDARRSGRLEDTSGEHILGNNHSGAIKGQITSVHVELRVLRGFIRVRDTSELGDNSSTCLLVQSLDIAGFANLKRGRDVGLAEIEASILVELLSHIASFFVRGDESDKDNLASHVEELGHFSNAADVLSAVFSRETETLVEASADDIAIEDENALVVSQLLVESLLEVLRESRFASAGQTSEPVSGSLFA